jgi:hypothetical protein
LKQETRKETNNDKVYSGPEDNFEKCTLTHILVRTVTAKPVANGKRKENETNE